MKVLRKERFNNWYKLKTYYSAYVVASVPMQISFSLAYTVSSFFLTAQANEWDRFVMFLTICILTTLSAESFGIVLGTTVDPIVSDFLAL